MKKVYLEPAWKLSISARTFAAHPPEGYQFVVPQSLSQRFSKLASSKDFSYTFQNRLGQLVPLWLAKSYFEKFKPGPKADLTYAITHLVFRKEPWVLDMLTELPYLLVGTDRYLDRYQTLVRRTLASPYCRKIICWVEAGKKAIERQIGEELGSKVEVVYGAVPPRAFVKEYRDDRVRLLMVNSANMNTAEHFFNKGGKEVVQAFLELSQKYSNLDLVIRSSMPERLKKEYSRLANVRILDRPVPWDELEQEWKSADIFVLPNFVSTPAMVFLDAMSYELPIVTTDIWGNSELVGNGENGLLVSRSEVAEYVDGCVMHFDSAEYRKAITSLDPKMVRALVDKIGLLVDNEELRRKLGKAGRYEVEQGRFSIEKRTEKLKRIFDEATA